MFIRKEEKQKFSIMRGNKYLCKNYKKQFPMCISYVKTYTACNSNTQSFMKMHGAKIAPKIPRAKIKYFMRDLVISSRPVVNRSGDLVLKKKMGSI